MQQNLMDTDIGIELDTHSNEKQIFTIRSNKNFSSRANLPNPETISIDNSILEIRKHFDRKTLSTVKTSLLFILFTIILMTIGILVVCLTSREPNKVCQLNYKQTAKNVRGYDSQPRSLALGDFNQRNKLDIVVANSGEDNIEILFRDDNGTFINQTTYSTGPGSRPYSVVVDDFNQDNLLDIAVANYGTNNIGIFLGKGNGTFANQTTFSTDNSHPLFITVGDFNNDSKPDIAVVNYGTNNIGILLGYGDGTLEKQMTYSIGYDSIPYALAVGDFNNDTRLDIAVANYGTNDIAIFLGYGNGSFISPFRYTTTSGSRPSSIAIADFNNDHHLDIVVANYGTNNIGIFFGYGNGSFAAQTTLFIGIQSHPQFVTIGDLNKDNQIDIVIVDSTNSHVHILPGYGNGTFSDLTTYTTGYQTLPFAAAIGDFDHDNQSDIAVLNYGTNNILILTGYSSALSAIQTQYSVGKNSHPSSVVIGDFNNDRFLDIVVSKSSTDSIGILFGYGDGRFAKEISYKIQSGSAPNCVCFGDFNNDSRIDLAVANYGTHTVGVLLGYGNGSFATMITYSTGFESFPIFVAVGDFNNDYTLDIVAANFRVDNVIIFLGYGNGSFAEGVTYSTGVGSDPSAIVVADFNKDTQLDLAVANFEDSTIGILFGNGDGTFRTIITYSTGYQSHPDAISAGDFNNDHWLDIVVTDSTSDNVAILLGYENGTFRDALMYTDYTFSNPSGIVIGDINHDNQLDIVITNFGTDNVGFLIGYGNGSFFVSISYPLTQGSGPKGIALGDFNNDTRREIVVVESGIGAVNLLVCYMEAEFKIQTTYSTGSAPHPHAVVIGDFNHDNRSDIAIANSGNDNVGVFLGYGNGSFTPQKTYFIGLYSGPQYVTVGDFNRDNLLDIATANTNNDSISILLGDGNGNFTDITFYLTTDGSQPYWISTGDFNNDHRSDIVVANQGEDNIGIFLGYDYPTFKDQQIYSNQYSLRPSSVTTCDFNNDTYLDIAAAFAANDSVGILFGYGNSTFAELIMYSVGYNSYPYEILSIDVNNDTILDIIVANSGSSTLGVLLGYCNGTFAPVMTFSTGIDSRPYDAASGDFNNDNRVDIVVANYYSNSIGILLGYGNGTFATVVIYSTEDDSRPESVAVSEFNQDNIADIVVANYRRDNVGVFLGNGDGTFRSQIKYSTGYRSMPTFVIVDDFNNDHKSDIAVSNQLSDNVGILYGNGNGTFTPIALYPTGDGTSPQCIRSGDFNNDKVMDIAVASPGNNYVKILYGLGDENFLLGQSISTGTKSGPISIALGDFDGDVRLDFTTANYLMNNVGVHISYGNQSFGSLKTYSTGTDSHPYSVAVSDFNNDGRSDVVVANYGTNNIGILLGYGNGTFATIVTYSMGDNSRPVAITTGDLNDDNQPDIVVVNSETNNIYILLGYGNGSFAIVTIYPTGFRSRPYGVTIGDFNNDNILDIIIVTAGTNTVLLVQGYGNGTFGNAISYVIGYNFDPYAVALADFNEDGWLDIAIANYGGDYVEILLKIC